jgi:putative hemolysin
MLVEVSFVLLLVALNGFFAMSELAIICARRARLQWRADAGSTGARIALELVDNPTRFLSTVQIGITLIGIFAGAFGGATIARLVATQLVESGVEPRFAQPLSIGGVVMALTFLSVVVGELVPKRIAMINPDGIASATAPAIALLSGAARPVVSFLQICTEAILRVFGVRSVSRAVVTDEEINALVEEGADQGSIDPAERHMVEQVLRLADRPVRTIMTRRRDVVWLDVRDSEATVRNKIANNGYSRLLVCDETLDNCLGYVRARALVDGLLEGAPLDLHSLVREPLRVNAALKTLELMARFRRSRPHLAVVSDEYGTTLGLVTPADVMGSITGELPDDMLARARVVRRDDDSWIVDARIELHDLERAVGAEGLAAKRPFMTLARLVLDDLERIPVSGEFVMVSGWRLEVVEVDDKHIESVLVSRSAEVPGMPETARALGHGVRSALHRTIASASLQRPMAAREPDALHRWEDDGGAARTARGTARRYGLAMRTMAEDRVRAEHDGPVEGDRFSAPQESTIRGTAVAPFTAPHESQP